jgi:uncharacterized protein with HEPN domain
VPRDVGLYLEDILGAARRVRSYTDQMVEASFRADPRTIDADLRNLEIIGEAARCLPDQVCARAPEIEWRKIAGMRDLLVHAYFAVNLAIVWDVVRNKLPQLEKAVSRLQADPGGD